MNQLDWLTQHRLVAVTRRDHDWLFTFDGETILVVECLWRLVEGKRIRLTSLDDGQQFGLPAPEPEMPGWLAGARHVFSRPGDFERSASKPPR